MQIISKIYLPSTNSSSTSVCGILAVFCSTSVGKYIKGTEVFVTTPAKRTCFIHKLSYYNFEKK